MSATITIIDLPGFLVLYLESTNSVIANGSEHSVDSLLAHIDSGSSDDFEGLTREDQLHIAERVG